MSLQDRLGRSISDSPPDKERNLRQGIDLATTFKCIEKNFVITDPKLPDKPITFASDSFLELTEYSREGILGRNCGRNLERGSFMLFAQRLVAAPKRNKERRPALVIYRPCHGWCGIRGGRWVVVK